MAVVGSAEIVVRAITNQVKRDIQAAFDNARPVAKKAGEQAGQDYASGFSSSAQSSIRSALDGAFSGASGSASREGREAGQDFGQGAAAGVAGSGGAIGNAAERAMGSAGGRGGNAFSRALDSPFARASIKASAVFTNIFALGNIAGTGVASLVAALSAAVSGLFAMASAAGQAAGALAVLPGLISVAAQAGGTLMAAFSGVGGALTAGLKPAAPAAAAVGKAAKSAVAPSYALVDAQKSLQDAVRSAGQAAAASANQVADAQTALARARQTAAQAASDAARQVQDAERGVATAQREVLDVQRQLNAARAEAAETYQQLAFSAEEAGLSEERAALSVQDAYEALQAAKDLPANDRARIEAELSYKEAELAYRQAKDRNADLTKEQRAAAKAGIAGSEEVLSVREQEADAQEALADAERGLADARLAQARSAVSSAQSVQDAEGALADARAAQAQQAADSARAIADAKEQVRRAAESEALAQRNATAATVAAAPAVDAYAEAMKNLSPAAQEFVRYLISIKDAFDPLKQAAGEELFPRLQTAIQNILDSNLLIVLADGIRETGKQLGLMAIDVSRAVTSTEGLSRIENILGGNNAVLRVFTRRSEDGSSAVTDLVKVALRLGEAIQPLTLRFANWIAKLIGSAEAATRGANGMAKLSNFFDRAGDRAALLGRIIGNLFGVIGGLARAADPAGKGLLRSLNQYLAGLNKWINDAEGQNKLGLYFEGVADNMRSLGNLARAVGRAFGRLGDNKGVSDFAEGLVPAVDNIGQIADQMAAAGGSFAEFITKLTELGVLLADTGGIEIFFDVLNGALDLLFSTGEAVAGVIDSIFGEGKGKATFLWVTGAFAAARALSFVLFTAKTLFKILVGGPLGFVNSLKKIKTFRTSTLGKWMFDARGEATVTNEALDRVGPDPARMRVNGRQGGQALMQALNSAVSAAGPKLTATISAAVRQAKVGVQAAAAALGAPIMTGISTGVTAAPPGALGTSIGAKVRAAGAQAKTAAAALGTSVMTGVSAGVKAAPLGTLGTSLGAKVRAAGPQLKTAAGGLAVDLIRGLTAGIKAGGPQVTAAATGLAQALVRAIKTQLGIKSPSTVFASVGRDSGRGLELGLEASEPGAFKAGKELGAAAAAGARSVPVVPNTAGAAAAAAPAAAAPAAARVPAVVVPPAAGVAKTAAATSKMGKVAGAASKGVSGLAKGFGVLSLALLGVSAPIAAIIAGVALLVYGLVRLYSASPEFKKFVDGIVSKLQELGAWFKEILNKYVVPFLNDMFKKVNEYLPKIGEIIGNVFDVVVPIAKAIIGFFIRNWPILAGILFGPIGLAVALIIKYWGKIRGAAIKLYEWIKDSVEKIKDAWISVRDKIVGMVVAIAKKWVAFKQRMADLKDRLNEAVEAVKAKWDSFREKIAAVIAFIMGRWDNFKRNMGILRDYILSRVENIKEKWDSFREKIAAVVAAIMAKWNTFKSALSILRGIVEDRVNDLKDKWGEFQEKIATVIEAVKEKFADFKAKLVDLKESIFDRVSDIKDKFGEIPEAIANAFGGMKDAASGKLLTFVNFLNDKVIGNINQVTSKFGMTIPKISTSGFEKGGYTGYGGAKDVAGIVHRDEHVIRKPSRRRFEAEHPGVLEHINRTGRLPLSVLPDPRSAGLARGGAGEIVSWLRSTATDTIGGVTNIGKKVAADGVGNVLEAVIRGARGSLNLDTSVGFNRFLVGVFDKMADAADRWGGNQGAQPNGKIPPRVSRGGGNYTGPPGGWTYPLSGSYPAYTFSGHNPANAIDIGSPTGTAVLAATRGIVQSVIDLGGTSYGKYIVLSHANGVQTLYAHLSQFLVRAGQSIRTGQLIGRSGATGGVTGPHLHFEYNPSSSTRAAMAARGVRLARGGVVQATPGGVLATIGEAGRNERVEPLALDGFSSRDRAMIDLIKKSIAANNNSGGGDTYHVHPSAGMNEGELAHMVSRKVAWKRSVGT